MTGKRILAIGECMAELAPADGADSFRLGFAGDTFNTAWYMAQIAPSLEVVYLTAVGDDTISDQMLAFMRASGVDTAHIARRSGQTVGLYMIHLEGGERSFSYWRGQSAARHLAEDRAALDRAIDAADVVYVSGITLAILNGAARDRLLAALQRGRDAGKTVAFDTNLRPRLWQSTKEMAETIMRTAAHADLVLPSFDDEAEWFGDVDPNATVERFARAGVNRIIVKDSARAVVYRDGSADGRVAIEPVDHVVDTTAAGDSFNAAVLAGLLDGKSMHASIVEGARLARRVIGQKGALVPVGGGQP